jgi:hypothetical protein
MKACLPAPLLICAANCGYQCHPECQQSDGANLPGATKSQKQKAVAPWYCPRCLPFFPPTPAAQSSASVKIATPETQEVIKSESGDNSASKKRKRSPGKVDNNSSDSNSGVLSKPASTEVSNSRPEKGKRSNKESVAVQPEAIPPHEDSNDDAKEAQSETASGEPTTDLSAPATAELCVTAAQVAPVTAPEPVQLAVVNSSVVQDLLSEAKTRILTSNELAIVDVFRSWAPLDELEGVLQALRAHRQSISSGLKSSLNAHLSA